MLLASLFVPITHAYAQEKIVGEQSVDLGDALDKAYEYSFDTGGIGIVMSYGTENGISAEDMGSIFVNEFTRRGYKSKYFFYRTDRAGIAMTFRIGYSSLGPWNPDDAVVHLSDITDRADAAHKIHEN